MLAQRPRLQTRCRGSEKARSSPISSSSPPTSNRVPPRTRSSKSSCAEEEQEASTASPRKMSRSATSSLQIGRRDALAAVASLSLAFIRTPLAAAAESSTTTTTEASSSSAAASTAGQSSSSSSEHFEAADFSLTVPAGFGLAEVAKAGYAPTTAEERGARGRGIAAPDSPVKVRFTAPQRAGSDGGVVGSSELSVIAREAAGIKPTFLMVTDISQWGNAAAVGALLLPRGVTVTRASTESVELPERDTGSIAGVVASLPQTSYLYEFEDKRGDLYVTLAAVARAGKIYVVAGSARGNAAWEVRRQGLREAVRSFRVTPTLR